MGRRLIVGTMLALAAWAAGMPEAPAIGGDTKCLPTSCGAPTPACNTTTWGKDNCGNACSKTGPACCTVTGCDAPAPTCSTPTTTGTSNCGGSCTRTLSVSCGAATPACGTVTYGTDTCGKACSRTGPSCFSWAPYGFAVPGDPVYGFPAAKDKGQPVYPNPNTQDLIGLAAKGSIIIGDYTSDEFKTKILPNLRPATEAHPEGKTKAYVIDPSDGSLGYSNAAPIVCGGRSPCFDGDYAGKDGGFKPAEDDDELPSERRFYEATMSDDEFKELIDKNDPLFRTDREATLDGVLYTNHALAGKVDAKTLWMNGSVIARDDALTANQKLAISHDIRLLRDESKELALPFTVKRLKLSTITECPESGC